MKRSALSLFAAVTAAAAAAPVATAATPTRVGVDREHQVSFSLTGAQLTVTLRPVDEQANPLARQLAGKRASIACFGTSPSTGEELVAFRDFTWKKGATSYRGKLSADISDGVDWCVLERPQPPRKDYASTTKMRVPNPSAPPAPAAPAEG